MLYYSFRVVFLCSFFPWCGSHEIDKSFCAAKNCFIYHKNHILLIDLLCKYLMVDNIYKFKMHSKSKVTITLANVA